STALPGREPAVPSARSGPSPAPQAHARAVATSPSGRREISSPGSIPDSAGPETAHCGSVCPATSGVVAEWSRIDCACTVPGGVFRRAATRERLASRKGPPEPVAVAAIPSTERPRLLGVPGKCQQKTGHRQARALVFCNQHPGQVIVQKANQWREPGPHCGHCLPPFRDPLKRLLEM